MIKKIRFSAVLTIGMMTLAMGQRAQNEYLEGKRLFNTGNFAAAESAFNDLRDDPDFGPYARFYRGLSLYRSSDVASAREIWKQLLAFYPNWENVQEVLYWLSVASFRISENANALQYLTSYEEMTNSTSLSAELIPQYLDSASINDLSRYYHLYPDNYALGRLLASRITVQPYQERNGNLLQDIYTELKIEPVEVLDVDLENVYRSSYSAAVLLPFMFESLENVGGITRNKLVMDLYQGMETAIGDLDSIGIKLDLYPYDTKKDFDETVKLFENISDADVIIGPLYPEPIRAIRELSKELKINMINPLSSNEDYIGDNPFAYLIRAGYNTMARKLAQYASVQHENPYTLIYFENNPRDSLFAELFRETMETAGKLVVDFRPLDELSAKALHDTLTAQYEEVYPKEVADSLMEIEGRFIKTRRLKEVEEESGNEDPELKLPWFYERDEEGNRVANADKMVAYEMKFKVPRDTVGSILIATRSNTLVNNLLSALATREDSTGLYGYGDWLDFKVVNYRILDQLGVKLALAEYLDTESGMYDRLYRKMMIKYQTVPSEFHFHGYEMTFFIGRMLNQYGKYFQNGFYREGIIPGLLNSGYDFRGANDNQMVPIISVDNYKVYTIEEPENNKQ